jgi:hypothetical protein
MSQAYFALKQRAATPILAVLAIIAILSFAAGAVQNLAHQPLHRYEADTGGQPSTGESSRGESAIAVPCSRMVTKLYWWYATAPMSTRNHLARSLRALSLRPGL